MEMEEPDVKFLVFLTITISLFDGQIFNYKQLALGTKIGDPNKDWWSNQDWQILWNLPRLPTLIYLYLMVCNSDSYYWNFIKFKAIYGFVRVSLISWCRTIYRVKILVWRRNVDKYVQMIDDLRKSSEGIFSASGAKPINRVRSTGHPQSDRQPPADLPVALFDPDWLEEVDKDYRQITLSVSEEDFHWMEFQPDIVEV